MRIVHLARALSSGGGERMVAELSNRMARLGHEVTVCMMERPDANPARAMMRHALSADVRFVSLDIPGRWTPRQMQRVSRRLREMKADILHIHMCGIWYLLPILLNPRPGDPVIVETIHTLPSQALTRSWEKHVMTRLYRSGRIHAVVLSPLCAREFREMHAPARCTVIPNGRSAVVPSERLSDVKEEIRRLRGDNKDPLFVHIGRFHEAKNQKCLVDAFKRLRVMGKPGTLLLIGRGYDSSQAAALRSEADADIHFLGEKSNPGDYLLLSDFMCLSSAYEGIPVTIIEALSCGVTPVCTPAGGVTDMLTDGVTGYISPSFSSDDFAGTLLRACDRPLPPSALRSHYASAYTIETCADRYLSLYRSLSHGAEEADIKSPDKP